MNKSRQMVAESEELNRSYHLVKWSVRATVNGDWRTHSDWINSILAIEYFPNYLGHTVDESERFICNMR